MLNYKYILKLKILQINSVVNFGSTGHIAEDIGQMLIDNGRESYIAYGRLPNSKIIRINHKNDIYIHGIKTRLFDKHGLGSSRATRIFIEKVKELKPDIIHLHNLHGYYINIQILFDFLAIANIPVIWTFHDCWSFTGHCAYFDYIGCNRWQSVCYSCPQKKEYPASYLFDRSQKNFHLKKSLFTSVGKMVLVPVSHWLEDLIKKSFFSNTDVTVIHNGIDTSLFKPQINQIETKRKYNLKDEFVILGVANPWSKRKGFADILELSKHLNEDEKIILVGLSEKQIKNLPSNIIGLRKTEDKQKLVDLYSVADLFINPTWEDSFPTTNIEALSCGTPVATYNTGGSIEAVSPETGFIVEKGSISGLVEVISKVKSKGKKQFPDACRIRAEDYFNKDKQFSKYLELYDSMLNY
jgi:glycosyltransferase involved in cell wall biosynthesis